MVLRNEEANITSFFRPKDLVSVLNIVFGFASIVLTYEGLLSYAAGAMIAAVVADSLDGYVARRFSTPTAFGEAIDIADLVSFGVAPGFLIIVWIEATPLRYLVGLIIVIAALLRLARYQVREEHDGWVGVPITVNGLLYPALFFANIPATFVLSIAVVVALLNISSINMPRP